MNVDKLKNIKSLINAQLEYLNDLLDEKALPIQYNSDKVGFFAISLDIQKEINRLKKEYK